MSKFKRKDGKVVIESLEDLDVYIKQNFPDGLEAKRKSDFFDNNIGSSVVTSNDHLCNEIPVRGFETFAE